MLLFIYILSFSGLIGILIGTGVTTFVHAVYETYEISLLSKEIMMFLVRSVLFIIYSSTLLNFIEWIYQKLNLKFFKRKWLSKFKEIVFLAIIFNLHYFATLYITQPINSAVVISIITTILSFAIGITIKNILDSFYKINELNLLH